MTVSEAKKRIGEGQFLKGSMLPKVTACVRFVESGGKHAIICALGHAIDGIEGKSGTRVAN
jgi:carbamate kinase